MCCGRLDVGLAIDCHIRWLSFPWLCWEFCFLSIVDCGLLPSFIVGLWLLKYLGFGLLLSCFGHARAKNKSELSCGLSCVSPVGWDCLLVVFSFFTEL